MTIFERHRSALYFLVIFLILFGIYLPGLKNDLIFDDLRLVDGSIFGEYGGLLSFKQRMLSYGSFVWIQELFGEGWWKQRLLNIFLHFGVLCSLYAFLHSILKTHSNFLESEKQEEVGRSHTAALQVAVALFALNPVAVYAVAYLAQRSIVMATLFVILFFWSFVRGLQTGKVLWFIGAALSYIAAVLSKEYAVSMALMIVPIYIYVCRPGWKKTIAVAIGSIFLLLVAVIAFWQIYGELVGRVFDEQSIDFVRQLEQLRPGISEKIYPLSILNEAALFFVYGFLWIFPNVQWMSIDLRPAFPLGFDSILHVLGALAYIAIFACSVWLVVRSSGAWRLVALLTLLPLIGYVTEFATVWVQDPFVLYRSYLWAIALPGLVAMVLMQFNPRHIYVFGVVVGLAFAGLALERVLSLKNAGTAWADAAEKTDRNAPANAVGRSRIYLNLGSYRLEKGMYEQAERDFAIAEAIGDTGGKARFSIGMVQQLQKKHRQALQSFEAAHAQGYRGQTIDYHRGESYLALGNFMQAHQYFNAALHHPVETIEDGDKFLQLIQLRHAETAIGAGKYEVAIAGFKKLLQNRPNNLSLQINLGMALIGQGESEQAIILFDKVLARQPEPGAYYGRAIAQQRLGHVKQSLSDIDQAIRMDPRNARYQALREQIVGASVR